MLVDKMKKHIMCYYWYNLFTFIVLIGLTVHQDILVTLGTKIYFRAKNVFVIKGALTRKSKRSSRCKTGAFL